MTEFKAYQNEDYQALCDFLIELNRDSKDHINWNWARFEWMAVHPLTDKEHLDTIGLWIDEGKIVGAAIYDMYFGEAFCAALPAHSHLYPEILDYAYRALMDENGLGIAIRDDNRFELEAAEKAGFTKAEQTETVMRIPLDNAFPVELPDGYRFENLDPGTEAYDFQWLLWQGFDHGVDRAEFEREDPIVPQIRRHLDPYLSVAAVNADGEKVAYCCVWYSDQTDYAYIEPVCVIPSCRGKGLAKAVIYEALNRAEARGATCAYVLSDMDFYQKLGFQPFRHYTFYHRSSKRD